MDLAIIAIFSLLIGSFLNVCIHRIPRNLSVVSPARSLCPKCEEQLSWWHNIPVLSWVILGAKCGFCKEKISWRYPLVELLSVAAAVGSYAQFGGITPTSVLVYIFCACLIAITFIDFDFKIIPDVFSITGTIFGWCVAVVSQYTDVFQPPSFLGRSEYRHIINEGVVDSLLGSLAGSGFFLLVLFGYFMVTKKFGLGLGDVKLMAFVGALFGLKAILPTIFMGSLIGSVVGIGVMLAQKSGRHTEIAFGPWLALGAILFIFTDIPLFRF